MEKKKHSDKNAVIFNRVSPEIHQKLKYIAQYEGRTVNGQALYLILNCIRDFEKENGPIPLPNEDETE